MYINKFYFHEKKNIYIQVHIHINIFLLDIIISKLNFNTHKVKKKTNKLEFRERIFIATAFTNGNDSNLIKLLGFVLFQIIDYRLKKMKIGFGDLIFWGETFQYTSSDPKSNIVSFHVHTLFVDLIRYMHTLLEDPLKCYRVNQHS